MDGAPQQWVDGLNELRSVQSERPWLMNNLSHPLIEEEEGRDNEHAQTARRFSCGEGKR